MQNFIKIKIIIGSTRQSRFGDKPAKWIFNILKKNNKIKPELLDLRDYPMPFFNEPNSPASVKDNYPNPIANKWAKKIKDADGLIIISPEYNHGYSSVLKNALDYIYKEWKNKPVGIISYGGVGGARSIEQLQQILLALEMIPTKKNINIFNPWDLVDKEGKLKKNILNQYKKRAESLISELFFFIKKLKST